MKMTLPVTVTIERDDRGPVLCIRPVANAAAAHVAEFDLQGELRIATNGLGKWLARYDAVPLDGSPGSYDALFAECARNIGAKEQ